MKQAKRAASYESRTAAGDVDPARAPARSAPLDAVRGASRLRSVALDPTPSLFTARAVAVAAPGTVILDLGGERVSAAVDPSVHAVVVAGAAARGERLLVERDPKGALTVIGALRTQPTPGIDVAEEYTIEAGRVNVRGEEISIATQAAGIAIRAIGEIESYADRIVSRAEGVHKIIGRMLRLN